MIPGKVIAFLLVVILLLISAVYISRTAELGKGILNFKKNPYCEVSELTLSQASEYIRTAIDEQDLGKAQREVLRNIDCFHITSFDLDDVYNKQGDTYRKILYCGLDLDALPQEQAAAVTIAIKKENLCST